MLDYLKKFLKNELVGLLQTAKAIFKPPTLLPDEKLTIDNYPAEHKIAEQISNKANFHPENITLRGNPGDTNGSADHENRSVVMDRGNLKSDSLFVGTYAHELGHLKFTKLHSKLNLGYVKIPYGLLLSATTNMYSMGLSAYAVMGDNKMLDWANGLSHHTGKYLIATALVNTVLVRTKEHMADLFAYKHTGLLPSEYLEQDSKRNGIIGNVVKIIGDVNAKIYSGYPSHLERDFICKILGKKPKDNSFVEQLKAERTNVAGELHK